MADQKRSRVDLCRELKEHLEIDPDLFTKVITGDESLCYAYDPPNSVKPCDLPKVITLLKLGMCCGIYGVPNDCLRQI
jgi:hypothetical protein